jgi:hypothetical protein
MATVFSVLEVSHNHVPDEIRYRLDELDGVTVDRLSYGWMIFVPKQADGDIALHPALEELFAHARRYRCRYVIVDIEADDDDPELPIYDA